SVMRPRKAGIWGRCSRTSSSSDSRPSSASRRMAKPVNCLEREATWNTVVGVISTPCSRSAMPYPREGTTSPSWSTATPQPGELGPCQVANRASMSGSALTALRLSRVCTECQVLLVAQIALYLADPMVLSVARDGSGGASMSRRLLILGAGTGASNNLVRSLRVADPSLRIAGCHSDRFLLKRSAADRRYLIPRSAERGYTRALRRVVRAEDAELLIPTTDADVRVLSRARGRIPCRLFLPREATIES